ncbi:uncharacterized protein LOC121857953 [Homarus americanus]|uniref:uncharacterized protein LOC121857953 n=1 Tax=Homarus americanus TaxID=6706 RepID=UPI001C45068F|nr:uncharacterized protein LOC121857953 [Homarus americanus]
MFLARQNLPVRGHWEDMLTINKGNFLELVELLSNYDPVLKEHLLEVKHAIPSQTSGRRVSSYLSPNIQNEFICLLGNNVKEKILADIKKAKYFGILFDSTPDMSHTDQMSEVIRYVHIEGDSVEVRESFLGFFPIAGKTANELTKDILSNLESDGLDINFCCSQGYDNAATMAEGISLENCTVKLNGLKLFLRSQRNEIVERAIQYATTQCEEMGISMETRGRIRRKKMMPGEMARDAGLTMQEEIRRSMFECLDRFSLELDARSEAMHNILSIFEAIQPSYMLSAKEEQQLQGNISNSSMTKIFNEISDEDVMVEIMQLCRHMEAAKITPEEANKWIVLQFLKFIVKWDFCETLPNLSLCLRFFLTICVSVASCERSFSILKLIKNYLRSSMTRARLNSLAMISIENECAKTVNFDEIIGQSSAIGQVSDKSELKKAVPFSLCNTLQSCAG